MQPYRTAAKASDGELSSEHRESDWALAGVLGSMWLLSFARVVLGLLGHEVFGTEGCIALVLVVILPPAVKNAIF